MSEYLKEARGHKKAIDSLSASGVTKGHICYSILVGHNVAYHDLMREHYYEVANDKKYNMHGKQLDWWYKELQTLAEEVAASNEQRAQV